MRRFSMIAVIAIGVSIPPAQGESGEEPAWRLELNKPIEFACQTKAVVVAQDAANATTGTLRLSLVLKEASGSLQRGVWRVIDADPGHAGSLGHRHAQTCVEACPLTMTQDDQLQLWAPAPKSIDQLANGEILLLAVVKTASLDLRATTFSGNEIEALEEGSCRITP